MALLIHTLFRLGSLMPLWLLHALGIALGWVSFLSSGRYRRRLLAHARQAGMPRAVALRSVGEAGKLVTELPRLWLGAPVPVAWQGAEHIDAAIASGRGLLFLTPHLGCFEITAQAYAAKKLIQEATYCPEQIAIVPAAFSANRPDIIQYLIYASGNQFFPFVNKATVCRYVYML